MKKFRDIVSKDKVSGFEASARNSIANRKQLDEEFELAILNDKGFVFIDIDSKPYWCRMYDNAPWFLYWNEGQKSWVTLRKVNQTEIWQAYQRVIPKEQAEMYHSSHRKFIGEIEKL